MTASPTYIFFQTEEEINAFCEATNASESIEYQLKTLLKSLKGTRKPILGVKKDDIKRGRISDTRTFDVEGLAAHLKEKGSTPIDPREFIPSQRPKKQEVKSGETIPTEPEDTNLESDDFESVTSRGFVSSKRINANPVNVAVSEVKMNFNEFDWKKFVLPTLEPASVQLTYLKKDEMAVIPAILFADPEGNEAQLSAQEIFAKYGVTKNDIGIFHRGKNIWPEKFVLEGLDGNNYKQVIRNGYLSPIAFVTIMALNMESCKNQKPAAAFRAGMICRGIFPLPAKHYNAISKHEDTAHLEMGECETNSQLIPEWNVVVGAPQIDTFKTCLAFTKTLEFKGAISALLCDSGAYAGFRHFTNDHYLVSGDDRMAKRVETEKRSLRIPTEWNNEMTTEMWARTMVHPMGFPQLLNWAYACLAHGFLFSATELRARRPHQSWNGVSAISAVVLTITSMPFGSIFQEAYAGAIQQLAELNDELSKVFLITTPLYNYYGFRNQRKVEDKDRDIMDRLIGICASFMNQFAEHSQLASALSFKKQSTVESASYLTFNDIWKSYRKKLKSEDPGNLLRQAGKNVSRNQQQAAAQQGAQAVAQTATPAIAAPP